MSSPSTVATRRPPSPDEGIKNMIAARILGALVPLFFLVNLAVTIVITVVLPQQWLRTVPNLVSMILLFTVWLLVRRGLVIIATHASFSIVITGIILGMIFNGGVNAPIYTAFLPLVMAAAWFYGPRAAILLGLFDLVLGGLFVWLQYRGWITHAEPVTPGMWWFLLMCYLLFAEVVAVVPNRMLHRTLRESESRRREAEEMRLREERTSRVLAESERQYRLLADNSSDVIWSMSLDGYTTYISPSVERMTGFTVEERLKLSVEDILLPESVTKVRERLRHELSLPRDQRSPFAIVELQQYHKDGSVIDIEVSASWMVDEDGKLVGVQGLTRDVSERKRSERERARLEEQLRLSQRIEAVGQLAGGVAHDLNNLLMPILGYAELLADRPGRSATDREALNQIAKAGAKARDLVHQLLAFSRKQTLEIKNVDLNVLVRDVEKLLRRAIREDITIEFNPASVLLPVQADAGQLQQVLMNLAVNAQDAMPGGGRLIITTGRVTLNRSPLGIVHEFQPGEYVTLEVRDTGIGMDGSVRERIFEPFFSTKGSKGTGLGLATSYGIVKQHTGVIRVESEPGRGTTFTIYLPRTDDRSEEADVIPERPVQQGGSETILIAEDNDQVREIVNDILQAKGYTVIQTFGARDALAELEQRRDQINLLVTDVVMPELSGKDLYLRAARIKPGLKVLYMSGYAHDVIAHRGILEEGANFIQKPFSSSALLQKVRQVLDEP